jgi:hypothetical protein
MDMRTWIVAALTGVFPAVAHADHHGMAMSSDEQPADESSFGASISLLAASYGSTYYVGDYQGFIPSLSWAKGRFSASASLPLYRIDENGVTLDGVGDFITSGSARLLDIPGGTAGLSLAVSLPTTDGMAGLFGMDHVMVMPMAWGMWTAGRATLTLSGGYSRAITDLAEHMHGPMPVVEPMNMSEITFGGGVDLALGHQIHAGARISGGIPVDVTGADRVVGAVRLGWGRSRLTTNAELQAGFAGDPFTVRGVVETALRF